jgi:hypothetical protein
MYGAYSLFDLSLDTSFTVLGFAAFSNSKHINRIATAINKMVVDETVNCFPPMTRSRKTLTFLK